MRRVLGRPERTVSSEGRQPDAGSPLAGPAGQGSGATGWPGDAPELQTALVAAVARSSAAGAHERVGELSCPLLRRPARAPGGPVAAKLTADASFPRAG